MSMAERVFGGAALVLCLFALIRGFNFPGYRDAVYVIFHDLVTALIISASAMLYFEAMLGKSRYQCYLAF